MRSSCFMQSQGPVRMIYHSMDASPCDKNSRFGNQQVFFIFHNIEGLLVKPQFQLRNR